ncbi:MAG TPA: hypothetical protein PLU93_09880 [Treponemataceae bacterium]|jgi:hypothetical protein|nr:hypothetical protein [Treponemataceae bacterium]
MEYKVSIYENGKPRVRTLYIERVPYKVILLAQRIERMINETRENVSAIQALDAENKSLRADRPAGWKDKTAENTREIKELTDKIRDVEDAGFFSDRFEAIKLILSVNGIKEDDELMNPKTWMEKMDYSDPMAFITFAVQKDVDKKKLVGQILRSTLDD